MAEVKNYRDKTLQASAIRVQQATLPGNLDMTAYKTVSLVADSLMFRVNPEGESDRDAIKVTANLQGVVGTPVFSVVKGEAILQPVEGEPNSVTVAFSSMVTDHVELSVVVDDDSTFRESQSEPLNRYSATLSLFKFYNHSSSRSVTLTCETQVIDYTTGSAVPNAVEIVATAKNTIGTPYYRFLLAGSEVAFSTDNTLSVAPSPVYLDTPYAVGVEVYEGSPDGKKVAVDELNLYAIKDGTGDMKVVLTNHFHQVPVYSSGAIDYTGSGTFIEVYQGTTKFTYDNSDSPANGTFSVAASGQDLTPGSATPELYGVTFSSASDLTANFGEITYQVSIKKLDGTEEVLPVVQRVEKSSVTTPQNAIGVGARTVTLLADTLVARYDQVGENPDVSTLQITAAAKNMIGETYYQFVREGVTEQNSASATYACPVGATYFDMPVTVEVIAKEGGPEGTPVASDSITLYGVKPGTDAVTVSISNEAHTIPEDTDGTLSYSGSGTEIQVWQGDTQLNYDPTPVYGAGSFRVTAIPTDVEVGALTAADDHTCVVGDHSALTKNTASVLYLITVTTLDRQEMVVRKTQSITKAVHGARGYSAKTVALATTAQAFSYNDAGSVPSPQNASVSATCRNVLGTPYYEFVVDGTTIQNGQTASFTYEPDASSFQMPELVEVFVREDSPTGAVVAHDRMTMIGVRPGSSAVNALLSDENATVPAGADGTADLTGISTTLKVWEGAAQLDYDADAAINFTNPEDGHFTAKVTLQGLSGHTKSSGVDYLTITPHASAMAGDNATITFEIKARTASGALTQFTKVMTLSKARRGADGIQGVDGVRGAGHYFTTGSSWADSAANSACPGGTPILDDQVTISNGTNYVMTRRWSGSAWVDVGYVIDGNLVVPGSITAAGINTNGLTIRDTQGNIVFSAAHNLDWTRLKNVLVTSAQIQSVAADKVSANALSTITSNIGTCTAGVVKSSDGKVEVNLNDKFIKISS